MSTPSIGFSDFYTTNARKEMGNSYTTIPSLSILNLIHHLWDLRKPGTGEGDRVDRKVLVPVDIVEVPASTFFCPPRVKLALGMPLRAEVVARQEGEDPFVEVFITPEDAAGYDFIDTPAKNINFVVYSAAALLENGGQRTTECEWEIVTLLCSPDDGVELMEPLTMARNWKELAGGTKPAVPYTCDEWADAVLAKKSKGIKVRKPRKT